MKNKPLLVAVAVLSLVSLVACSSPKKESSGPSSSESTSTSVVKETIESSSKVEKKHQMVIRVLKKLNESVQQIMDMSISRVTGKI